MQGLEVKIELQPPYTNYEKKHVYSEPNRRDTVLFVSKHKFANTESFNITDNSLFILKH